MESLKADFGTRDVLHFHFQDSIVIGLFLQCLKFVLAQTLELHLDGVDALGEVLQVVPIFPILLLVLMSIKLLLFDHHKRSVLRLGEFFFFLPSLFIGLAPGFDDLIVVLQALFSNDDVFGFNQVFHLVRQALKDLSILQLLVYLRNFPLIEYFLARKWLHWQFKCLRIRLDLPMESIQDFGANFFVTEERSHVLLATTIIASCVTFLRVVQPLVPDAALRDLGLLN